MLHFGSAGGSEAELPTIAAADRGERIPLSFAQERLWFLAQFDAAASRAHHVTFTLPLNGELDRAALRRALDEIVARHEALRTTFTASDGEPLQRIAPPGRGFPLVEHDPNAPFDLEAGPLVRGRLLASDDGGHALLVTMHGLVSDGWSAGVLARELSALYAAYRAGRPSPLPPLAVQYADYAVWQRRSARGEALQAQAAYWQRALANAPVLLELPADRARPARQDFAGDRIDVAFDAKLTAGLAALSRRHGTTLFATLLAAWGALLWRLSGQDDVVVGTVVPNRARPELEPLIGFFANTLALRLDFSGNPTVSEALARVSAQARAGDAHRDVPFEHVVELVDPPRSLSHSPLFQTMFVWKQEELGAGAPPAAKFDLTLELAEHDGRIAGTLVYATALFDRATVERYGGYLERLLAAMVADDERALDRIALLSEDERRRVLVAWNATERPYPADVCVHELFEAQAEKSPGAVAVSHEGEQLSYGELNARANRLARHLRTLGVGADVRVGVCAERSVEMVVALLAVLKAGGAYVPLDPGYPLERLAYLVKDSNPALVLTHARASAAVQALLRAHVAVLDVVADAKRWAHEPASNPDRTGLSARSLAYVIYTSGSTGHPKGAMNEHHAVVNRLRWGQDTFGLTADDAVMQKTPFSFDVSVWEFFWPLASGARLVMARADGHKDPDYLGGLVREQRITTLHFVPSMLQFFLEHDESAAYPTLKNVICSGEALTKPIAQQFYARFPQVQLTNLYGPTEAAVEVTAWPCPKGNLPENIPIGRPIANTRMYVLDAHLEPVPVGVTGDLSIGGVQVARGYLNRPELTAERFVDNPFVAGERLYKTGDLARFLSNGDIEFLGRRDFQVKIRGSRIELGEIETRLAEYPGVREAVVVALDGAEGEKRLVAYYTAATGTGVRADALRAHVLSLLPDYMVPAAYVQLESMPLTASGKLDRRSLPAPDGGAYAARAYEPPVGELEIALAEIWRELLKVERVGRNDNFFELGGHSLLAMRVFARARRTLHVEASLTELFAHPTLSSFARTLKSAKRSALPAIVPVERGERIPLSFAQERLWFLAHLDPAASRAYHAPFALPLQGALDVVALRRALDEIVARHESLRTTFAVAGGEPVQRIAPPGCGFQLVEHDLRGSGDAAGALAVLASHEARAPFDLEAGPLVRGRVIALAHDDHVLLVTTHHIVSDGWSMNVFARELSALYAAYRDGATSPLPPPALQYADYAVWQRRWTSGKALQEPAAYWQRALANAPVLLELPTDRPRPARQDFAGGDVALALDAELAAGLAALSRRHGTTLFATLLAAWGALLSRLSGQTDVVVGTAVANRARPELEPLIGFFVNTLALRLDFGGDPTVSEALARVSAQAVAGQEHQDVPFEHVVELVNPPRSLAHSPLFQAMFVWQSAESGSSALRPGTSEAAKFDLTLELAEHDGVIAGGLVYATALFDCATVERYGEYFWRLLAAMVADDRRALDRVPLLSDDERRQVLVAWNATERPYPADECVHELFEAQVAASPGAVAVSYEGEQLSYGELNARANRLARHLRALGVGPDVRVGVCLERSVEMVVALLGVLKAGGAYVPLDPGYPLERLSYLVQDSAPAVVLTHGRVSAAVRELLRTDAAVVDVVADAQRWAREAADDVDRAGLSAHHLAYVIYTSGSTGQPKGAMNEHGAVVNRLRWTQEQYGLTAADAVLQKTPFSFDVSVWEFFWPLLSGARLVLARPDGHKDADYLVELVQRQRITTLHFVPSMLQLFLEHDGVAACTSLSNVICSGEALPKTVVQRFYERLGHARLSNLYGPTEAAVDVTAWACPKDNLPENIPIGRPVANTRMYVLDGHMEPVPAGVAGDLYIGGAQVGRGYLNRPELTAERFVASPFVEGDRLYKTGDVARYLRNGDIEFLGRSDFQVKLRGFRIELGEVEARLAAYPGVREAVVVALDDGAGEQRLVGYYTLDAGTELCAVGLRAHMLSLLPDYMVPAAFVQLKAMPLSPNGKLDRRALPVPAGGVHRAHAFEAPAGATEEALAQIWRELLGLEQVGRNDDFFELGGHSLLAMRVLLRVREQLHVEGHLADLFSRPALRDMAAALEHSKHRALPAIVPVERGERIPLSFAQERLWFLAQLDSAASRAYHVPFGLPFEGALDVAALRCALDEMVARHESLRTTFAVVDGRPVQRIAPAGSGFALVEHDLRRSRDAAGELDRLAADEANAPFDLEVGPLVRGRLVTLDAGTHLLLVTAHHIVFDGWSVGVFARELRALYAAYGAGAASPLPAPVLHYADYAVWQRRWMSGDALQEQAAYWQRALVNAPVLLELPADRPRPAAQDFAGGDVRIAFDAELTAGLVALSRRHGTTLFTTLLAAWGALLSRLSGQTDVVVGTAVANRARPELQPLIGFFVNTLALRLDFSGEPTMSEALGRAKAQTVAGQAHQDVPFEHVVELINPPRSLAHTPLFQTMFVWQNAENDGGVQAEMPGAPSAAKFDLTLELAEQGDRIAGTLVYATALFDRATVERYGAYLRRLLAAMAADDQRALDRVPLLSEDERRQVLVDWNATARAYPAGECVHELFEAQVAASPDAVAVSYEGEQLSYGELNAQANRLARHLRALGVAPDVRVGVCLERSVEMVVALLAVLKAGGAYVPLDPGYPLERLSYLVRDSAPAIVLTHARVSAAVRELLRTDAPVVDVVADAHGWTHEAAHDLDRAGLSAHHLAYVIYTSGSTGQPKGAMNEHGAVVNRLRWAQETCGLTAADAVLQKTPFSFDVSVWEFFWPLLSGARLVMARPDGHKDPDYLVELVQRERITTLHFVPSMLQLFLEHDGLAGCTSLANVICSGEALSKTVVQRFYARLPHARLSNLYGPTEAAVDVTAWTCPKDNLPENIPIGRPVANTRMYVLDAHLEPVPVGVAGDLYIGGAQVGRGYLNRPELTAERFVASPFVAGDRLYKTGDLARYLRNGDIAFLGRSDFQVKLRGFRIELGEIEAQLAAYPGVREAVVVALDGGTGEQRLVAYFSAAAASAVTAVALRTHLLSLLPEYMVPAAFVQLQALPLSPNGKLDRNALPAPDDGAYGSRAYEAPAGDVEIALAAIWRELLGVERVGRNDNFFELGGNSLLIVHVMQRMRREDLHVDIRELFTAKTLASLARITTELGEVRI